MKLVFMSDSHNKHDDLQMPKGDILIHSGDATNFGRIEEIVKFNKFLESIESKYEYILFVPGNHDKLFERDPELARQLLPSAIVLIDEHVTIGNTTFFGSPYQPTFGKGWAFNKSETFLRWYWEDAIDRQTDVVITHSPPFGTLDQIPNGESVGCKYMAAAIAKVRPKVHAFGHIHFSRGMYKSRGSTFINSSICGENYKATNQPVVYKI